jgi:hypothetical protein
MGKLRYIVIGLVFLLFVITVLLWVGKPQSPRGGTNGTSQVPDYALTDKQQEHFKILVQTLIEGYNSYSYYDYITLVDVQGNSTPRLAADIQTVMDQLHSDPAKRTFTISTVADPNTFAYRYPEADTILADMRAKVVEKNGNSNRAYETQAHLTLKRQPDGTWLLDNIILSKIN